jgi:hypothetical protein
MIGRAISGVTLVSAITLRTELGRLVSESQKGFDVAKSINFSDQDLLWKLNDLKFK